MKRSFYSDDGPADAYDSHSYDSPPPLMITDGLYDTCGWANDPVDISASMANWKDFTHLLGYNHVWFSELGHPDPARRDVPLLTDKVVVSDTKNSYTVFPPISIAQGQTFPANVGMVKGKSFYVLMPFRLSDAFMYPLGNYKRQFPKKDGKTSSNYCPQTKFELKKQLKYSYCYNTSAANASFAIKDPVSEEALRWLSSYEEEMAKIFTNNKSMLGTKFRAENNKYLEATWSPFQDAPKEGDVDFTPIHEEFAELQNSKTVQFMPPRMFRLNPKFALDDTKEPLISVPVEEQHAYELEGDIHLICFKVNRAAGKDKTLCVDLHHVIALEAGYDSVPSKTWFNLAQQRTPTLTKEELFEIKPKPLREFKKNA